MNISRTRRTLAIATCLAAGLTLVGCGEDSSDSSSDSAADSAQEGGLAPTTIINLTPDEAAPLINSGDYTIIDVRTPEEFAEGHVVGAVNINFQGSDFSEQIADLATDEDYLVYCRSGNRSSQATAQMSSLGLQSIRNVNSGGFAELADAGAPVE